MARYNLIPKFENVKSYYDKTQVEFENNIKRLFSYNVLVCEINVEENTFYLYKDFNFSQTTLRHVKEFLKQHNSFWDYNKSRLEYIYNNQLGGL